MDFGWTVKGYNFKTIDVFPAKTLQIFFFLQESITKQVMD